GLRAADPAKKEVPQGQRIGAIGVCEHGSSTAFAPGPATSLLATYARSIRNLSAAGGQIFAASVQKPLELPAQAAQDAALGNIDGVLGSTELTGHFRRGAAGNDILPECLPGARLELRLNELRRLPGDVLPILGLIELDGRVSLSEVGKLSIA